MDKEDERKSKNLDAFNAQTRLAAAFDSARKSIADNGRTLDVNTEKGREKFQEDLDITHQLFKDFVGRYRPQLHMDEVATGEVWPKAVPMSTRTVAPAAPPAPATCTSGMSAAGVCTKDGSASSCTTGSAVHSWMPWFT